MLASFLILPLEAEGGEPTNEAVFLRVENELRAVQLPEALSRSRDVRWTSEGRILLATFMEGTHEVEIKEAGVDYQPIMGTFPNFGPYGTHFHLAITTEWIVVGSALRTLFWRRAGGGADEPPQVNDMSFDSIMDLDAFGDQLVVAGPRRGRTGEYSPNGIIGWRATIQADELAYRPFFTSSSGPGAPSMSACNLMFLGKVRFMKDGSYVFLPGVEPGVFHYGVDGLLKMTWDTAELGIDTDCDHDRKTAERYFMDETRRYIEWINKRVIVDDILPLPTGPGLVIRRREGDLTLWQLKILHSSGEVTTEEIPIAAPYPLAHLKGDVRSDGAIVYLVVEPHTTDLAPAHPRYIFISEATSSAVSSSSPP